MILAQGAVTVDHQQSSAEEWENIPKPGQVGGAHVQVGWGEPGGGQEMVPARPHLGGRNDSK